MKHRLIAEFSLLSLVLLACCSCYRSDTRTAAIHVPQMHDARDVRIVTNAALNQVAGRYDGPQHAYEVNLDKGLLLYHESRLLLSESYRAHIESCLSEIGYEAEIAKVVFNPPPPIPTRDGLVHPWKDRFTALISVPGMHTATDANRVIDAIAFARIGRDDPRIRVDRGNQRLNITYSGRNLGLKNLEYAIANAGYDANDTPAECRFTHALPCGWTPLAL